MGYTINENRRRKGLPELVDTLPPGEREPDRYARDIYVREKEPMLIEDILLRLCVGLNSAAILILAITVIVMKIKGQ